MAAGPAELRVLRGAVATPEWRPGGQVEQPAEIRRVLDPRRSRLEQLEDPEGRCGDRGLEAEAGARRRDRRPSQLSARAHANRARPSRRAAAGRLPGRPRGGRAPLRRDQRQKAHAPHRFQDHRRRPRLPHLPARPRRLATTAPTSAGERLLGVTVRHPARLTTCAGWRRLTRRWPARSGHLIMGALDNWQRSDRKITELMWDTQASWGRRYIIGIALGTWSAGQSGVPRR